jgi:tRNA/tmRNA/rRNA uracil-C5-methylase (TrmA/RlmC/RlmD family)
MFPAYPHYVFYQFIRQHVQAQGPGLVVDAPCGGGYITDLVARDLPSKKVVGVDIDPACVEHARKNYHRDNLDFQSAGYPSFAGQLRNDR